MTLVNVLWYQNVSCSNANLGIFARRVRYECITVHDRGITNSWGRDRKSYVHPSAQELLVFGMHTNRVTSSSYIDSTEPE